MCTQASQERQSHKWSSIFSTSIQCDFSRTSSCQLSDSIIYLGDMTSLATGNNYIVRQLLLLQY